MATNKKGSLESLKLKDHCEMCGASQRNPNSLPLEAAFNPSGKPMTLCRDCRMGSAELLHENATKINEAAKSLSGMNVSGALESLKDNGYIFEANALAHLASVATGTKADFSECQNCGTLWGDDLLNPVEDIGQRVGPGEPMPSGECPDEDCRAVCHTI
jgi:hypothetical protein